ncbi:hypothetical protein LJC27_06710, partial [Christensenellaceae bacterium OttesenSCG-928-M15]|nr:hypothetical protein [Christensenellaceae bacterium OttesenSCG-928-M15]
GGNRTMFHVGEGVIHPGHGGCVVDDVGVRPWKEASDTFYMLRPIMDENLKVFVPIDGAENIGIRKAISAAEATEIIEGFSSLTYEWQPDFKKRRETCSLILRGNDIFALSKMVKAYMCLSDKSHSSSTDNELYAASKKKFISELALALGENAETVEKAMYARISPQKNAV